jgi:hypothetical protein
VLIKLLSHWQSPPGGVALPIRGTDRFLLTVATSFPLDTTDKRKKIGGGKQEEEEEKRSDREKSSFGECLFCLSNLVILLYRSNKLCDCGRFFPDLKAQLLFLAVIKCWLCRKFCCRRCAHHLTKKQIVCVTLHSLHADCFGFNVTYIHSANSVYYCCHQVQLVEKEGITTRYKRWLTTAACLSTQRCHRRILALLRLALPLYLQTSMAKIREIRGQSTSLGVGGGGFVEQPK